MGFPKLDICEKKTAQYRIKNQIQYIQFLEWFKNITHVTKLNKDIDCYSKRYIKQAPEETSLQ